MIPRSKADTIIHYPARCYSGQFSNDGNFFFSCGQDFKVRMYDTSNPYNWRYYKVVDNPYGQWTITDASLSPDNKFLAYSSISRIVCLAPTDPNDNSTPRTLDFSRMSSGSASMGHRGYSHFGIWSIRFSGDGREIVAGTGDRAVYVFDIERNMSILRIPGHQDDVNAVCFGDTNSPHILYSGSDDTTLKVWDRRSMGDGRAAGVFLGHTEGLTYVDSKGDGRYIISNGKDQTAKLWDLRKVMPTSDFEKINVERYTTGFEYRTNAFNYSDWSPHPHDSSLVTFRGHQVLRTLIRCHFSPPGSTDSRYVYSGSYDGKVYVWNLDATLKGVVDVASATEHLRTRERREYEDGFWGQSGFQTCVRDASWHPDVPMIAGMSSPALFHLVGQLLIFIPVATSWNGWGTSLGTCTVHSWNDDVSEDEAEPRSGLRVNAKLEPERVARPSNQRTWFGRRRRGEEAADDE
jgi:WD repeat-containing protein 23